MKRAFNRRGVTMLLAAAAMLATSTAARADVLFSNFGPGDSYLGNAGWSLANGGPFGAHLEDAVIFTVGANGGSDYFFNSAEFGIGLLFGPNVLHVTLHSDSGGVPGAILEQVTVIDGMGPLSTEPGDFNPPVVANFSGNTILQSGMSYWLSVSTDTSTDSWAAWNENIMGDLGLRAFRENGGPWNPSTGNPRGVFRVNATPVPAPGALALLALAGAVARRRRSE